MKLKLFTLYLLFFGSILSAQEILKTNKTIDTSVLSNDLMDKMAEETCECVKKLDFSGMPQNQIEMNLGMCILQSISSNKIEVENQLGAFYNLYHDGRIWGKNGFANAFILFRFFHQ